MTQSRSDTSVFARGPCLFLRLLPEGEEREHDQEDDSEQDKEGEDARLLTPYEPLLWEEEERRISSL